MKKRQAEGLIPTGRRRHTGNDIDRQTESPRSIKTEKQTKRYREICSYKCQQQTDKI